MAYLNSNGQLSLRSAQDLPKSASFKMIDWWLFFASNVLVITMAFHTYLGYLCEEARQERLQQASGGDGSGGRCLSLPRLIFWAKRRRSSSSLSPAGGLSSPAVVLDGLDAAASTDAGRQQLANGGRRRSAVSEHQQQRLSAGGPRFSERGALEVLCYRLCPYLSVRTHVNGACAVCAT